MKDIEEIMEEHGDDCILQVEDCTGVNGFDLLLCNPSVADRTFEMIAIMIMNLTVWNTPSCHT
eukprot:CAMPEP_0176497128 /NCGR_PEP_ID=MMETSP0200_2-20121128/11554_1 /TAXON_ID=947934 /ORGANISM="Chaetoceros sp., Strain GSL56" /LENGTH=62 /DNA_ID=CAMNT_0017895111 /DNA_START=1017 /DNA_END=1202 /DNA_ORIENTATION=+